MVNLANKKLRLRKDEMMKKLILTLLFSNTLLFGGNNTFFEDFSGLDEVFYEISVVFDDRNFAQVGKEICKEKRWFPRSYDDVFEFFKRQAGACLYLGLIKADSDKEKFTLIKKVCDIKSPYQVFACLQTAEFYKNGIGTSKNFQKATEIYGQICQVFEDEKACRKQ